ncbi:MAG: bifunctional adenosylcobinamide kinase/adenosylcobinamide-phosphate guanylyltransferase [Saccharofermentanales bacterium]
MITLIIGGAFQGKTEFADSFGKPVIQGLHEIIRDLYFKGADVENEIMTLLKNADNDNGKDIVVVCNEIGCGIVPLDRAEREYREIAGRILCDVAKKAQIVYRVQAGIATKIKG